LQGNDGDPEGAPNQQVTVFVFSLAGFEFPSAPPFLIETIPSLHLAFTPCHAIQHVLRRNGKAAAQEEAQGSPGNYRGHDDQGNDETRNVLRTGSRLNGSAIQGQTPAQPKTSLSSAPNWTEQFQLGHYT
jgi:hypothetical protein